MVYRFISWDVKLAAIHLIKCDLIPLEVVLECCDISECTWYQIQALWRRTGDVINPKPSLQGRIRTLDVDDVQYLVRLVRQNPDYFLDKLLHLLQTNRSISVHYVTIHQELERAEMSYKKLKRIALERDEGRWADFIS